MAEHIIEHVISIIGSIIIGVWFINFCCDTFLGIDVLEKIQKYFR